MTNHNQSKNIKNWFSNQAWVVILVTFLTVLLGIVISEIQSKVGWLTLIVSLVTIIAVYGLTAWLNFRYAYSVSTELAREVQGTLDKYIALDKIDWILTMDQLVELEKKINVPEIWLISSDLGEDVVGKPFFNVVSENIKRGIKYRYFVPDTPEIRSRVSQVIKRHKNLKTTYLNDQFFFLIPKFDFVIYNPFIETGAERVAYMGIPVSSEKVHYHAKVDDTLIDVLIGVLMSYIDSAVERPYSQ